MTNIPKRNGTKFETACARYLCRRLDDDRVERRALHGSRDMGDLFGLWAHGTHGIVECKNYKDWGKSDLTAWKRQALDERDNADAGFVLLVVHKSGCGPKRFGENHCYVTLRDLHVLMDAECSKSSDEFWVRLTLDDACRLIEGSVRYE